MSVISCRSNACYNHFGLYNQDITFFQGVFRIPKQIVVSEIMPADAALKYYHKHRN